MAEYHAIPLMEVAPVTTPRNGQSPDVQNSHPLTRADVLQWFQHHPESDTSWVLNRLVETSPHLVIAAISDKLAVHQHLDVEANTIRNQSHQLSHLNDHRKSLRIEANEGHPVVQFTSSVYYAEEGVDSVVVLKVIRIGNREGTSEVSYQTFDDSALNGRSYVATSGMLVFGPGEAALNIEVPIIDNGLWDTTLEFECRLLPDVLKGAELGDYLSSARVRIMDNNFFPTDRFSALTSRKKIEDCSKWELLFGYFSMISNLPNVWCGTVKYVLVDTFHNLWHLFNLFMSVYILDYIVEESRLDSELFFIHDRRDSLIVCSLLTLVSVAFSHILDYARLTFPVVGPAKTFIQSALLRRFLHYKAIVREHISPQDVVTSIQRDAVDVVLHGYMNLLKMCSCFGKTICMLIFKLSAPLVFGHSYDWHAFLLLFFFVSVLPIFLSLREKKMHDTCHKRNSGQSDLISQIAMTVTKYRLVHDYGLQKYCEHKFLEKQKQAGMSLRDANQIFENNMQFCKWCQSLLTATWLLYGGLAVIDGSVSVGLFVTNLNVFQALGGVALEFYGIAVSVMNTFPALEDVTSLMNQPTEVKHRAGLKKLQQLETVKYSDELSHAALKEKAVLSDLMPIALKFIHPFTFDGKKTPSLVFKGHLELSQGQLIALVGPLGCGKATLLHLIAGTILPQGEKQSPVFTPAHVRVANVAEHPLFFSGSLYDNLVFGMDRSKAFASRQRVKEICLMLLKSYVIADHLDRDDDLVWQDIFSGDQCKLLGLARALVQNFELLCVHKPLAKLMDADAEHVMHALHDHVLDRGLGLATDPAKRRPRTIIMSSGNDRTVKEADKVVMVVPGLGLRLMEKQPMYETEESTLTNKNRPNVYPSELSSPKKDTSPSYSSPTTQPTPRRSPTFEF